MSEEKRDVTVQGVRGIAQAAALTGEIKRHASGDWLVDGYRRALARFREAESELDDPRETFIALFEALNWATSIAYYLKDQGQQRLPRTAAMMWIRGRVQHKWADAIEPLPIVLGPIKSTRVGVQPTPVFYWHWCQTNAIPDADEGHENPDGETAYQDLLAGHIVREALDDIERALNSQQ